MKLISKETVARFQSLFALLAMIIALSLMAGSWDGFLGFWAKFLTVDNSLNVLRQISVNLCLSIGMTLVILTGGIDLSVGALLGLSGAVAAGLFKDGLALKFFGVQLQFTVFGAIIAGFLVGVALGGGNGVAITRLKLPPFVATLGMLSIAQGLTMLWTRGKVIPSLGDDFSFMGSGTWLGLPMIVLIAGGVALLFHFLLQNTTFGRYIYAVGGNERAAEFAGLNVNRIKVWVYVLAGGLAGLAGLLQTARLNSATPTAGIGEELNCIAAVVIGGTSLSGGRGSIPGTVIGCLIIGVLNNGLVLLEVSPFWQQVIKGIVILAAVAVDKVANKKN